MFIDSYYFMIDSDEICFGIYHGIQVYGIKNQQNIIENFRLCKTTKVENYKLQALKKFFAQQYFFTTSTLIDFKNIDFSHSDIPLYFGYYSENIQVYRFNQGQGKRFFTRGINSYNCAANGAIMICNNIVTIRGGPICAFQQIPDLKPKPQFLNLKPTPKYVNNLISEHKNIFSLSLIDMKNRELLVSEQIFKSITQALKEVKIYSISFISEQFSTIDEESIILVDSELHDSNLMHFTEIQTFSEIDEGVYIISSSFHYFHLDYHKIICNKFQHKNTVLLEIFNLIPENFTLRVNCIDSLDRTGAVLSQYYRNLSGNQSTSKQHVVCGNVLARQYASSNSMKQDQQEFGKRTRNGKMQDLCTWFVRWIMNNLFDGKVQDGYILAQYQEISKNKQFRINFWWFSIVSVVTNVIISYLVGKLYISRSISIVIPVTSSVLSIGFFFVLVMILLSKSLVSTPRYCQKMVGK